MKRKYSDVSDVRNFLLNISARNADSRVLK